MPPNAMESDLEGFREEEDEDLKVFHKTKKVAKAMVSFDSIYSNTWVILNSYRILLMLETGFLLLRRIRNLQPQKT